MSCLFKEFHVGSMSLKNRFVRSATGEARADSRGILRDTVFPIYERLADGGVGLIITGHTYCHKDWKCSPNQTGIWSDEHIPGLARLATASHRNGVKAIVQINYAGRKPAEMGAAEIAEAVDCFAAAAQRAMQAGFDGVQIHAAHGYLLSCFLTPSENLRTDGYGRDADGRRRLLIEVAQRMRGELGAGVPVLCKLGALDGRDNSLPIEETVGTARALEVAGVDAIEVSCTLPGAHMHPAAEGIDSPEKEAYFAKQALAIKKAVGIPVILVGGLRSLDVMERVVHDGVCDLVSLCRPLIRQPELVNSFAAGMTRRSECVSCNKCFNPRGFRCVFADKQ